MITIEQVYEKLVQLTELCDREFKQLNAQVARTERRQRQQDSKLDSFIEEIIEMKRDLKHPV
jgi:hypothetical protein